MANDSGMTELDMRPIEIIGGVCLVMAAALAEGLAVAGIAEVAALLLPTPCTWGLVWVGGWLAVWHSGVLAWQARWFAEALDERRH